MLGRPLSPRDMVKSLRLWRSVLDTLIILFPIGTTATLLAQHRQVKFERIGLEQGLSQSTVNCILQDRRGFMWFGTQDGLNRYDGYKFTVYKHDVMDSSSVSDSYILSLYEDNDFNIWVGTLSGGLNKFDYSTERFTHFVNDPQNPSSLSNNRVFAIHGSHSEAAATLWIGTKSGLNKLTLRSGSIDHGQSLFGYFVYDPNNPNSQNFSTVRSIYEDRSGTLWIGTEGGLCRFEHNPGQVNYFFDDSMNTHNLNRNSVHAILEDRSGALWIGTDNGLCRINRLNDKLTLFINDPADPYSLGHNTVRSIYEDRFGSLWIGTSGGGLNRFDRETEQFVHFTHNSANPHSLSDNRVWSIYEDRSGALWIGTRDGGLNKFDRGQEHFNHFARDPANSHNLSDNVIRAIHEDRSGMLWIGTAHGLNRFDRKNQSFINFVNEPQSLLRINQQEITSIFEDSAMENTFWVGTDGGGLYKLILSKGEGSDLKNYVHYATDSDDPFSLSHDVVTSIHRDRHGTLWVGTWGGLNMLLTNRSMESNRAAGRFKRFVNDPWNPDCLGENRIWTILEDRTGALWIGTNGGGLNRFDHATGKFTRFVSDPANPRSLSSNNVLSICEDRSGTLWLGTSGGGLNRFDPPDTSLKSFYGEAAQFARFTEKDGLPNNVIYGILEDNKGYLWLSTNKGLSCLDPRSKTFRNYDVSHGLQSNEFNVGAYFRTRGGEMVFGGVNGFNVFHPDSIKDNPYIPPIVITAVKRHNIDDAKGVAIAEKGIPARREVQATYKDNILIIEFAALSYRSTFKNQYAYKLEGFNDNWIQLGARHDITFTNLDPGEYILRVKGSNNSGIWNEEGTFLRISIAPPPWKTWWAYTFYALVVTAMLYGLRRYELSRIQLENRLRIEHIEAEKIKELDHLKSRFFYNISHEFRTPLTLILGPVEQMRSGEFKGDAQEAYEVILRNGRRLLRLVNQLLDLAKLEAGRMSLQVRPENIVGFLRGLTQSFIPAAERKHITLAFSSREEKLIAHVDRDKLEKIASNLLSNALKFTPKGGSVIVAVGKGGLTPSATAIDTAPAGAIEFSVSDTGPGIPAEFRDKIFDRFYQVDESQTSEYEGTGLGLSITKELVELHGGEILVNSEVGRGTTFIVRLPYAPAQMGEEELVETAASENFGDSYIVSSGARVEEGRTPFTPSRSASPNAAPENEIVLIVEDNRDVRWYLRQYLEPAFEVVEAVDGIDGVQKALEIIPDLIVCDVMMPNRDGIELCRILKTDVKTSHVPIIMLTARADHDSKVHGLEIGADDYLAKPFDSRELLARVHNLVNQRRRLRERFRNEIVLMPREIAITPMEESFLNKVKAVVEEHLGDEDFEVESLGQEIGMSRSQIHRKLKALTGQSASQFIRSLRLARAVELLKRNAGTVAEIAYRVGFGSQTYFTKCFHEQFGCSPKEYVKSSFRE